MKIQRITLKVKNIDVATLAKIERLVKKCGGQVVASAESDDPPPQDPGGEPPPK